MAPVPAELVKQLRDRTGVGMGKCKEALEAAGGDIELAIEQLRKAGIAAAVKKESRATNEGVIKVAESPQAIALIEVNAETDFVVKNDQFQAFAENLAQEVLTTSPISVEELLKMPYSREPKRTIDDYRSSVVMSLGENIRVKRCELFLKKKNSAVAFYSHAGGRLVTLVEISGHQEAEALAKEIAMHVAAESPEYISSDEIPQRVLDHEREIAKAQIKNKPENIVDKIVEGKLRAYFDQVCLLNQRFIKNPEITIAQLLSNLAKELGCTLKLTQFLRWRVGE